ncbi:MAG: hypothetical protein J1E39_07135 [Eubacterium sp.]|nr:hypothetical protein [Eubacterium sp.]
MGMIEQLKELGVNIDEGLNRFMGNAALYERMLLKLPANVRAQEVLKHFEDGDFQAALEAAHNLKGVTGNLSVTPLYEAYTEAVKLLRENEPEKAKAVVENIQPVEEQILNCIENNN